MRSLLRYSLWSVWGLLLSPAALLGQGALMPTGAPGPTMRTLLQIEPRTPVLSLPYTISTSGAYYLAGNLTGSNGITIAADNVDLDLMGFTLSGSTGTNSGISVPASQINLRVRNGNIINWGGSGIDGLNAGNSHLERLRASGNSLCGLIIGTSGLVNDCAVFRNHYDGIRAGDGSSVKDCVARTNGTVSSSFAGGSGIVGGDTVSVSGCVTSQNYDSGIIVGPNSKVTGCSAMQNGFAQPPSQPGSKGAGIRTADFCSVIGCNASLNSSAPAWDAFGIVTGNGCTIKDCTASFNGAGIQTGRHCNIEGCTANYSVNTAPGVGIVAGTNNIISECVANSNNVVNIQLADSCMLKDSVIMAAKTSFDLTAGSRNVIIHNFVGATNPPTGGGSIQLYGTNNAVGTIDNAVSLNTNANPHANITP